MAPKPDLKWTVTRMWRFIELVCMVLKNKCGFLPVGYIKSMVYGGLMNDLGGLQQLAENTFQDI
jgi:hypothetical protein